MAHSALSGPFFPGYNANISGFVARFDTAGNMNGYMPISPGLVLMNTYDYVIHPVTGDQYVTGCFSIFNDSLAIGDTVLYPISNGDDLFLAKFDSAGQFKWALSLADTTGNAYFGLGLSFAGSDILLLGTGTKGQIIGNDTLVNPLMSISGPSFHYVARLTPAGTILWVTNPYVKYPTRDDGAIHVLNTNEAYFTASFTNGQIVFGNNSFNGTSGLRDIFLSKISLSGSIIDAVRINCTGSNDIPQCMTSDTFGNIFIGGGFDGTMTVNGVSYVYAGGNTDAFVAKYGYPCTSGMEEEEEAAAAAQQGLHIYPNPATEGFYIMHPYGALEQAEVYNLLGEKVITQLAASGQDRITIDISGLPAGMYVVTALRKGYRISGKLVVQKEE
jgi:hypothetical protein